MSVKKEVILQIKNAESLSSLDGTLSVETLIFEKFDTITKEYQVMLKDRKTYSREQFSEMINNKKVTEADINMVNFNNNAKTVFFDLNNAWDKAQVDFLRTHNRVSVKDILGTELNENASTNECIWELIDKTKNTVDRNELIRDKMNLVQFLTNIFDNHSELIPILYSHLGLGLTSDQLDEQSMKLAIYDLADHSTLTVKDRLSIDPNKLYDSVLVQLCIDKDVITNNDGIYYFKNKELKTTIPLILQMLSDEPNLKDLIESEFNFRYPNVLDGKKDNLNVLLYEKSDLKSLPKRSKVTVK